MAKKPKRVYSKSLGRMVEVDGEAAPPSGQAADRVQVYHDGFDTDRLSITQQVHEHPESHVARVLKEERSRYDELLNAIYDAVLITDLDGNILDVNYRTEHHFRWSRDELCVMNVVDVISGADDKLLDLLRTNVTNRKYTVLEAICLRADESRFNAEIVVNNLGAENNQQLCFLIRDETQRRQAEMELLDANEKLVDAEKTRTRFETISTLFYEFNNPLQILMCMAEIEKNKEYKKQLTRIISVLDQLRQEEDLEVVVGDEGETRYEISDSSDLIECDSGRILVVDDEKVLREMFVDVLKRSFPKMTLELAADGPEALDLFREGHHGLVIMDVSMPVMNGHKVFDEVVAVCEKKTWAMPPFIFCTGFVVGEGIQEIVGDQSFHSYLKKPLSLADLVEAVRKRLSGISDEASD